MIEGLAARWLFTAVFAVAGLGAALPRRDRAEWGRSADRFPAVLCVTMCAALIAMTWRSEPAAATWLQVAVFGCAALRLALASPARCGGRRQYPARGVLRGRVHPVAGAGRGPGASGKRSGLGQPGRDERRDGGDAVRDAVTASLEQTDGSR